jgi:hypothetical protein
MPSKFRKRLYGAEAKKLIMGLPLPQKIALQESLLGNTTVKEDCLIWNGRKSKDGYAVKSICGNDYKVHSLIFMLWNGHVAPCVCHSCDQRMCIRPAHLWSGTLSENSKDMHRKKRNFRFRGELHGASKLTQLDAKSIKIRKEPYSVLSREYGVSIGNIAHIKNGRTWKHLN